MACPKKHVAGPEFEREYLIGQYLPATGKFVGEDSKSKYYSFYNIKVFSLCCYPLWCLGYKLGIEHVEYGKLMALRIFACLCQNNKSISFNVKNKNHFTVIK